MNDSLKKRMKDEKFSRVNIDLFSGPGGLCTGFKWAASIDDYITECERNGIEGQLGTLFQWTYPYGGKGKRIQLKGKMI